MIACHSFGISFKSYLLRLSYGAFGLGGIGLWAMSNPCLDVFISERHRWISLSGEEDVGAVDRLRRISLTTILGLGEPSVLSMQKNLGAQLDAEYISWKNRPHNTNSIKIQHEHAHRSDNIQTYVEQKQKQTILTCGKERMAMAEVLNVPPLTPAELSKRTLLFKPCSFASAPALHPPN